MLYDPKRDIGVTGRVLLGAADLIERHGWCQGYQRDKKGRHCVKGAINRAAHEMDLPPLYASFAIAILRRHLGGSVIMWNDAIKTTKQQVIAVLRAVGWACDE